MPGRITSQQMAAASRAAARTTTSDAPKADPVNRSKAGAFSALVLDPCNAELVGMPDNYVGPTVPFRCKGDFTVASDANGYAVALCSPSVSVGYYNAATVTSGAVSAWGTAVALDKATALASEYSTYRVIGGCVKIGWIGASQTAAGRVVIMRTEQQAAAALLTSPSSWMADPVNSRVYTSEQLETEPVELRLHPFDGPVFNTTANSILNYLYFPCCVIGVMGAPNSTTVLSVDYTLIIEYVPVLTSLSNNMAKVYPSNPLDLAAGYNAAAHPHSDADARRKRRAAVDDTFRSMGALLSLANPSLGQALMNAPASYRQVRKTVKNSRRQGKKVKNQGK